MAGGRYSDRAVLAANQNKKEREYWLNKLSGDWKKSSFPADFPVKEPGQGEKREMAKESFEFSRELSGQAVKLSGGADVRLQMVLVTGLISLLSRYTGSSDIMIGSPIIKQEIEADFINRVLVFRNPVKQEMTFKELLLLVKDTIIEAADHQNFPLEVLPQLLKIPRDPANGFPLFDTVLLLENIHDKLYLQDIPYNMLFSFRRQDEHIKGTVEYISPGYQPGTIRRMINHLVIFLERALQDVEMPLYRVDILSGPEKARLLEEFNGSHLDFPGDKTLHRLFADQLEQTADNMAVVGKAGTQRDKRMVSVSYKELHERSERLARLLKQKGAAPGIIVGIMVERSIEMIIGILGILKAGAAYLPIDPGYPQDRINYILKDSQAKALVTTSNLAEEDEKLRSLEVKSSHETIFLDSIDASNPSSSHLLNFSTSPSSLAYIIYTSGSTGKPKGVLVEHVNAVAYLAAFWQEFAITARDTVIQLAAYTFDVFIEEVFPVLLKGGKIVIPPAAQQGIMDIEAIVEFIIRHQVSIMDCTPLLLKEFNGVNPENLSCIHTFISGGDVLKRDYVDRLLKIGKLYNTYGPTETTVCAAYYRCVPGALAFNIPIGKPISNYRVYILDQKNNLQPIGAPGELSISGPGVTRGYLNRPELTAAKFDHDLWDLQDYHDEKKNNKLQDTKKSAHELHELARINQKFLRGAPDASRGSFFKKRPPGRRRHKIYLTGDLARWLIDGNLEFLGRIDHQVKVRGYRIELGEIESRLLEHEDIKEAVVVQKIDGTADPYLCGYVVAHPDKTLLPGDLRSCLGQKLPDYMIPWFFMQLDRFPLTPSGKIHRKALPDIEAGKEKEYVAPRNQTEKVLVEIWSHVLGIEKESIGIDTYFFDLGGNSLKAIIIVSRIHKAFDVKMQLTDIFRMQTIRAAAGYIKNAAQEKFTSIKSVETKEYYTLSPAQKRLFILQRMDPDSTVYNLSNVVVLEGELKIAKLEEVFIKLIDRHESLRTSFQLAGGEPVQRIHREVEFEIETYDSDADEENYKLQITNKKETGTHHSSKNRIIHHFLVRPFDLSRAPLFQVGLVEIAETTRIFMLNMHHIITDAVSMGIFTRELITGSEAEDLTTGDTRLRIRYKDFSEWQNRMLTSGYIKKQEEYWLKEFPGGIPVLNLPYDYPRPEFQDFAGDNLGFVIDGEETRLLTAYARQEEVTLYMILLAVLTVLFSKLSSQEDIVIGSPVVGRRHADLEPIIGLFVNTLALRNYPYGEKTFKTLLAEVKERTLNAFENQEYQFEDLVEKVAVNRNMGRNPLFDVMFTFENITAPPGNMPAAKMKSSGLTLKPYEYQRKTAKFDLNFAGREQKNQLLFNVEYCTKLFKPETIKRFITYFKTIVSTIIYQPGPRLSGIEILPAEEKQRILDDFNDTSADYPRDKLIHELFEEQVEQTPDYIALVGTHQFRGEGTRGLAPLSVLVSLTYRQLNRKSHQLAHLLRQKGVKANTIVAIMMERSPEMVIGILGILKAGGAYLPIDPAYPDERIDYMLKDSSARILLKGNSIEPGKSKIRISKSETNPNDQNKISTPIVLNFKHLDFEFVSNFEFRASNLSSSTLAYVIYTSGSTGKPKGVLVEHNSAVNILFALFKEYPFTRKDTYLLKTSYIFDVSVSELFGWFFKGGRLAVLEKEAEKDPRHIIRTIINLYVTHINFVPSMFGMFLEVLDTQTIKQLYSTGLKYIFLAGEALPPIMVAKFRQLDPGRKIRLENIYGPTEGTVYAAKYPLSEWNTGDKIPIGKPMQNVKLYILGRYYCLQPVGVPGELYIGGKGVAVGYLNNPELTAGTFCLRRPGGALFEKTAPPGPPRKNFF